MGVEKTLETSQNPTVVVDQIYGNLQLRAWDESQVMISGDGESYIMQEGNEVRIGDFGNCRILVPVAASVTFSRVHGNAQIIGVRGSLQAEMIHGNLRGEEWGDAQFRRVDGDLDVHEIAGSVTVGKIGGNCTLREVKGDVHVDDVSGNCTLREVVGAGSVKRVRGNLTLQEIHSLTVEGVSGNVNLKSVGGNVQLSKVGGNVHAIDMMGDLNVESVGGDLKVRELIGGLNARLGGAAKLYLHELSIPFVSIHAGGDIRCQVPVELNAKLSLRSGNEMSIKNLPLPNYWNSRQMEFTVGNGEGRLDLTSGNRIKLLGVEEGESEPDWEVDAEFQFVGDFNERATELVQQVAEQVESQVEAFTRQLNERLAALDNGDAIANKVQQKVQSAMRQAEDKIADAMRRAERQAERQASRESRYRGRMTPPVPPVPSVPPVPPVPAMPPVGMGATFYGHGPTATATPKSQPNPPSAEERMLVLKMLEEGKISVEQAEQLLAAMGEQ